MSMGTTPNQPALLSRPLTLAMSVTTGLAVSNIYYNQPMLHIMSRDLPDAATAIPTVTQLGYAIGLFALVPLGDLTDRRKLIVTQFVVLAAALALMAVAQGATMVIAASIAVGMAATVTQHIIPFAAHMSSPSNRGATVGTMMSGLLAGMLLSRTAAGFVSTSYGWRAVYVIASPIALAAALVMWRMLPAVPPAVNLGYRAAIRSMGALWRTYPELRRSSSTQALIFAGFSAFWTVLPFYLAERFTLGADVAGLFGIVGLVGVLAAPIAGRVSDAYSPQLTVRLGALVALASWLLFGSVLTMGALIVGVVLLDFGMQSALVANQSIVYSLLPEARSRLNTIFMGSLFLGGAAGSASAAYAWHFRGWIAVAGVFVAASAVAIAIQFMRPKLLDAALPQANLETTTK